MKIHFRPAAASLFNSFRSWKLLPGVLLSAIGLAAVLSISFPPSSATAQGKLSDKEAAKKLGLTVAELQQLNDGFGMTKEMLLALPPKKMHRWYRKLARGNVQRDRAA